GGYRVAHAVIAETALAAVADDEIARMRGRLGGHLLSRLDAPTGAAALRVAMALSHGRIELSDPERVRAAECHAIAGEPVMASSAYGVATTLSAGAPELLAGTSDAAARGAWCAHRALQFRAELGRARALMMLGRHGEADAVFQTVTARELDPDELGTAYNSW